MSIDLNFVSGLHFTGSALAFGMDLVVLKRYVRPNGQVPFDDWIRRLPRTDAVRISVILRRIELGNTETLKALDGGLHEVKCPFGPGYRIYCHRAGEALIILFGGGAKGTQARDIERARALLGEHLAHGGG